MADLFNEGFRTRFRRSGAALLGDVCVKHIPSNPRFLNQWGMGLVIVEAGGWGACDGQSL